MWAFSGLGPSSELRAQAGWEDSRVGSVFTVVLPALCLDPPHLSGPPDLTDTLCLSQQALPSAEGWHTEQGPSWRQVPLISQDRGETYCGAWEIGCWEDLHLEWDRGHSWIHGCH